MAFVIAAVTYLLTIEPSSSFWDCGEFLSTAYKLDVGHPPGAPFFMLCGRFFANLLLLPISAQDDQFHVGVVERLDHSFPFLDNYPFDQEGGGKKEVHMSLGEVITVLGAGFVGALAYTFSDTFWFSAVESEVYAFSSLFTAVVFWSILKWEQVADQPHSDRWIIFIAYLMGLSIWVLLLNLLCIPALVLVYYF
jgi:hypothetical protein